jgi:predicted O-methyltransferase YrrM
MSVSDFMKALDPMLAEESRQVGEDLHYRADTLISEGNLIYRTQGDAALLYFLVRRSRATTVVETGVASGYSSAAVLQALERNDQAGVLWSSDLPYVRVPHPERHVGRLVPEGQRPQWRLLLDGDRRNLRVIAKQAAAISLFHYDSDKSYRGRRRAFSTLRPHFTPDAVLIFDDIEDNFHCRDLSKELNRDPIVLCSVEGKYVGVFPRPSDTEASELAADRVRSD